MTVTLLGLTEACSYTERYWNNDATCSGEPFYEESFNDEMNTCYGDEGEGQAEEEFGMVTQCSGGTFVWSNNGEDPSCTAKPYVEYAFQSGECKFVEHSNGNKIFGAITIDEAEVAPINTLLDLLLT